MPKIQKLPESLIRLIAAGEVVERPASVVKELVENSLDAGATQLDIDIWGAGRTRLRVSDNGEGMSREDAELALDRHATSKLRTFDGLYQLDTFGFRGEALPSIAAVSRLELSTRPLAESQAWKLTLDGGKLVSVDACSRNPGTTIDVQDLFFNTPARSKFLKRDSTERTHLLKTLEEMAVAHPAVSFIVSMDGKSALRLAAAPTLSRRIGDLWGLPVSEKLIELAVSQGPCQIRGLVNQIPAHHATKAHQILYVNRRPVQQRMLNHAIYEAYREWLPVGRHPLYALFVDIDSKLVDVNVHPTKREVRFSDERAVYDLLYRRIRDLFKSRTSSPIVDSRTARGSSAWIGRPPQAVEGLVEAALALFEPVPSTSTAEVGEGAMVADQPATRETPFNANGLRYLGQFQRLYLLIERDKELLLVDQHAAAERVLYERLLAEASKGRVARQPLLTPLVWDASSAQAEAARSYRAEIESLGFGLEPFGARTFALKEWPATLPDSKRAQRFLEELLEALAQERPVDKTKVQHEIAARAACRAAIMAGDPVTPPEAMQLLRDLSACERPMTCPHGRPTHIRLPLGELDRRFNRT